MLEKFMELENFFAGTFHQDIEDPKEALREYIDEADKQLLDVITNEITEFLLCDLTKHEKEQFIEASTFIYFPALGVKPVEWLENVLSEMKTKL